MAFSWDDIRETMLDEPREFKPAISPRPCQKCGGPMTTSEESSYCGSCENCFATPLRAVPKNRGRTRAEQGLVYYFA